MKKLDSNLLCPSCQASLTPKVLECQVCDIKVEGPFRLNEFATLPPEDLHFLRIFIRCEGRVRDMEPALGLSYPTIRARLTELKNKLSSGTPEEMNPVAQEVKPETPQEILSELESGKIDFDEAMARIKAASKTKSKGKK
jgi:hypothetical protein